MKNGFYPLSLIILLCLTSCNTDPDSSLTDAVSVTEEMAMKNTVRKTEIFSLPNPKTADSSSHYFFVENVAGTVEYQQFDFSGQTWQSVESLFQKNFLGGPLHTGRVIYQQALWRDSTRYMLLAKDIEQGMVIQVQPLAEIRINDEPSQSVYLFVPKNNAYRLSGCNNFDDWFTYCSQQRFYVQYWIEHQFKPRFIKRIQWRPFSIP